MKVRSDNKEGGDANEDDDKLFRNAGQTDETVAMLTVPSPSGLRFLLTYLFLISVQIFQFLNPPACAILADVLNRRRHS